MPLTTNGYLLSAIGARVNSGITSHARYTPRLSGGAISLQDALRRILSTHPGPTDTGPFITVALPIATLHLRNEAGSGAIRAGTYLEEERRANELWITLPGNARHEEAQPLMPWVFLEGERVQTIHVQTTGNEIERFVAELFAAQNTYRRSLPFTTLALIILTFFVRTGGHEGR